MSNSLNTEQSIDLALYTYYRQILLDAYAQGRWDGNLNVSEVAQIATIANANDRYVCRIAKNLLEWFYGYNFSNASIDSGDVRSENIKFVQHDMNLIIEKDLKVYPNPADSQIIFECNIDNLTNENTQLEIQIFNCVGQWVGSHDFNSGYLKLNLQREKLNTGMYYYLLKQNGNTLKQGKFIVK